jgi:hypothetical protein
LHSLHQCYEEWLGNPKQHFYHGNTPVLVIDGNIDITQDNNVYNIHSSHIMSALSTSLISIADR